jgi:hypothetical protein
MHPTAETIDSHTKHHAVARVDIPQSPIRIITGHVLRSCLLSVFFILPNVPHHLSRTAGATEASGAKRSQHPA